MEVSLFEKYPSLKKAEELGDKYVEWKDGREEALLRFIYAHPSFSSMRNNPRRICEAMDEFATQNDFLINIASDKGLKVVELISREQPKVFVELGGYLGYSAILFADEMRRCHGVDKTGMVYWSLEADPLFASIAMNLIDLAGLSGFVKVITGNADESLARMNKEGQLKNIDMLFLDHVEDFYHTDLQACESLGLLHKGACVVADNVLRPGAPKYREYLKAHPRYETTVLKGLIMPGEFEDEVYISKLKE